MTSFLLYTPKEYKYEKADGNLRYAIGTLTENFEIKGTGRPNLRTLAIYLKYLAYSYEEKIRIAHVVKYQSGLSYNWTNEKVSTGKYVRLNLDKLIDRIVVSPYSPNWYYEMIQNLVSKYGLKKRLNVLNCQ